MSNKPDPNAQMQRDAARYRHFRQLVKDDHIKAQSMVWNSFPSRKQFDRFVDESMKDQT